MKELPGETDKYTNAATLPARELTQWNERHGITNLRVEYLDLLGICRGKDVPAASADSLSEGITCCSSILTLAYDNTVVPTGVITDKLDDLTVAPDFSTLTALPHLPGTAAVIGDIVYHGKPFAGSPRVFLKAVTDAYRALGLMPICACELELFAYKRDPKRDWVPYTDAQCNCYTVGPRNDERGLFSGIADALTRMGYPLIGSNHEFYEGQYEFNWSHSPAVNAADRAIRFKTLCKEIACQKDLAVTFMAKPARAQGGSGCHVHLSLKDINTGRNLFFDPEKPSGMSDVMNHMLAGILLHAPACAAYLAPTINCYKRYQPDSLAPTHIAWGHDNRSAYLRVPAERGKATRIEVRGGSAAANPYLILGALLLAGLDGIQRKLSAPDATELNLYHDAAPGIRRLPVSLDEALDELEKDEAIGGGLGEALKSLYVPLKRYECAQFHRYVTDWETNTYFYHM